MPRVYPVANEVLVAILVAIDRGFTIQAQIAQETTRIIERPVGERTVWEGIKRLHKTGHLLKGHKLDDMKVLKYLILPKGLAMMDANHKQNVERLDKSHIEVKEF